MKIFSIIGICLILIFILSSCVAGPNKLEKTPDEEGKVAGFWKGIWHGFPLSRSSFRFFPTPFDSTRSTIADPGTISDSSLVLDCS